jgi:hypothetical protein
MSNVLPLRRLLVGPSPAPDRILFTELWYRGHNNPRYAQFLPRLERLDRYRLVVSDRRIARGLQFCALRGTAAVRDRLVFGAARRRGYWSLFTCDRPQIANWPGPWSRTATILSSASRRWSSSSARTSAPTWW